MKNYFSVYCRAFPIGRLSVLAGLGALVLWSFWPALGEIVQRWSTDPQYSHGYLVPLFALGLLWLRRGKLAKVVPSFSWWGVLLLASGESMHLAGAVFYVDWIEGLAFLVSVAGVCVLFGGWGVWRWAAPAVGFLVFMIPLPFRVEIALSQPLRRIATQAGAYALETLGFPAVVEGTTILMEDYQIGIAEACSGLGMLVTFFALSTAIALVMRPNWMHRLVIILSAVPIAIVANVVRIIVTAVLCEAVGNREAQAFFHDGAGWFMMPLALGMLWLELYLLGHLFVKREPQSQEASAQSPWMGTAGWVGVSQPVSSMP